MCVVAVRKLRGTEVQRGAKKILKRLTEQMNG